MQYIIKFYLKNVPDPLIYIDNLDNSFRLCVSQCRTVNVLDIYKAYISSECTNMVLKEFYQKLADCEIEKIEVLNNGILLSKLESNNIKQITSRWEFGVFNESMGHSEERLFFKEYYI